jgi:peptidoglycan/xylan/chitin deacetylase (PgdA/CDA1 family)
MKSIALRLDDPGASSKEYELYGKDYVRVGSLRAPMPSLMTNFLFLKRFPLWTGWAPYPELTADQWHALFEGLSDFDAKLTVAVTASWVERDGRLTPFPSKYPAAAAALKQGVMNGLIEVANHGLTHCIPGRHLPALFSSNRRYHREFTELLPPEQHFGNLKTAQSILQDWLGERVVTLVPPGNAFTPDTLSAARELGFEVVNCKTITRVEHGLLILGNEDVLDFHDRDIAAGGTFWLKNRLFADDVRYIFVKELAQETRQRLAIEDR